MERHTAGELPVLSLTAKGYQWAKGGHPWVYRDDVTGLRGSHGDVVAVTYDSRPLGLAFLSTQSKIALRWLERTESVSPPDAAFWRRRLEAAKGRRVEVAKVAEAYRVVNDAADGIPGLVVDKFGDVAVLQSTTPGVERLLETLVPLLVEILRVRAVVARNDLSVRTLEGLPRQVNVLAGDAPGELWVAENGPLRRVEYLVDPLAGQKTGAFLDQRENRWAAARHARGRFLDCFAYQGLFSLHAAPAVDEAVAVESSRAALGLLARAAERNGVTNLRPIGESVFDYLKGAQERGESFDTIVLDPPAFAKGKKDIPAAVRAYREINRRAMRILRPDGVLVTCSCSYNLSEELFLDVLRQSAAQGRADFHVLERRGQSGDHPVLLAHPEAQYLKCVVLRRVT